VLAPATILGGTENAISVARSLARAGVTVHAVGDPASPLRHSRHRASFVPVANGDLPAQFLACLEHGVRTGVVLACDDDGVEMIARHRSRVVELGYIPMEFDDSVALSMLDKDRTYALARSLGIPGPETFAVRTEEDISDIPADIAYPIAMKPVSSHVFKRRAGSSTKGLIVRNRAALEHHLAHFLALGVEMLVTEIVPGDEDQFVGYHAFLDRRGEPLLQLTKRKIRQLPPRFGRGCYHVTTHDPDVAELGLRFMRGLGAFGLGNVEFKRDARDGRLKLIELNYRFTATNELLRRAGIDAALFVYNRLTGRPVPAVDSYEAGVRIWHPVADARAAAALYLDGEISIGQWLHSVCHRQHLPVFSLSDPAPSFAHAVARARTRVVRKAPPAPPAAPGDGHAAGALTPTPAQRG
jgi:D-aspartate ligase